MSDKYEVKSGIGEGNWSLARIVKSKDLNKSEKDGVIKGGNWWSRSIYINNRDLSRDSVIDFLNEKMKHLGSDKVSVIKKGDKEYFVFKEGEKEYKVEKGKGLSKDFFNGESNEKIKAIFNQVTSTQFKPEESSVRTQEMSDVVGRSQELSDLLEKKIVDSLNLPEEMESFGQGEVEILTAGRDYGYFFDGSKLNIQFKDEQHRNLFSNFLKDEDIHYQITNPLERKYDIVLKKNEVFKLFSEKKLTDEEDYEKMTKTVNHKLEQEGGERVKPTQVESSVSESLEVGDFEEEPLNEDENPAMSRSNSRSRSSVDKSSSYDSSDRDLITTLSEHCKYKFNGLTHGLNADWKIIKTKDVFDPEIIYGLELVADVADRRKINIKIGKKESDWKQEGENLENFKLVLNQDEIKKYLNLGNDKFFLDVMENIMKDQE